MAVLPAHILNLIFFFVLSTAGVSHWEAEIAGPVCVCARMWCVCTDVRDIGLIR